MAGKTTDFFGVMERGLSGPSHGGKMADPAPGPAEEKFVVVPLGSDSKKIGQVIGSESCRRILDALTTEPASASQLAEKMGAPLTTVQYDIEKLLEAGLIKVERVARTEKMRQMKIYGPVRKLIVVVPEKLTSGSPADILRKYLGVFLGILFVGSLVEWAPSMGPGAPLAAPAGPGPLGAPVGGPPLTSPSAAPLLPEAVSTPAAGIPAIPAGEKQVVNVTNAWTSRDSSLYDYGNLSSATTNQSPATVVIPTPPAAATPTPTPIPLISPLSSPLFPSATALPQVVAAPYAPHYGLWFILGGTSALALLGAAGWALKRKKM